MIPINNVLAIYSNIGVRILEDDTDLVLDLLDIFSSFGVTNVMAYDTSNLFENNIDGNIHLAIIDDRLDNNSERQGVEVAEILRDIYKNMRLIFVTGSDKPIVLKRIIKLKPDEFIDKNSEGDLKEHIRSAVRRQLSFIRNNMEFANMIDESDY